MTLIESPIQSFEVVKEEPVTELPLPDLPEKRPEELTGKTYKLKSPLAPDHAFYITINDVVTPTGERRPYEIFINTKAADAEQWVKALTRLISAVWRSGGEYTFIADELESVFDPNGGYLKKGKKVPSLVAEIGEIVKRHIEG